MTLTRGEWARGVRYEEGIPRSVPKFLDLYFLLSSLTRMGNSLCCKLRVGVVHFASVYEHINLLQHGRTYLRHDVVEVGYTSNSSSPKHQIQALVHLATPKRCFILWIRGMLFVILIKGPLNAVLTMCIYYLSNSSRPKTL